MEREKKCLRGECKNEGKKKIRKKRKGDVARQIEKIYFFNEIKSLREGEEKEGDKHTNRQKHKQKHKQTDTEVGSERETDRQRENHT